LLDGEADTLLSQDRHEIFDEEIIVFSRDFDTRRPSVVQRGCRRKFTDEEFPNRHRLNSNNRDTEQYRINVLLRVPKDVVPVDTPQMCLRTANKVGSLR
jgi:hypothetical protein